MPIPGPATDPTKEGKTKVKEKARKINEKTNTKEIGEAVLKIHEPRSTPPLPNDK